MTRDKLIEVLKANLKIAGHDAWEGHYYHVDGFGCAADAILANLPPATPPSDERAKVIEECAKIAETTYLDEPANPAFEKMRIATAKAIRALFPPTNAPPTESELRQARVLGSEGVALAKFCTCLPDGYDYCDFCKNAAAAEKGR